MVKKILSTLFTRSFIALSNLIIAVLLSNYLGAAGRGEQSLIITLITFIIIIGGVVGSSSIAYLLPRFSFTTLIIPSYIWVILITAVCFFVLPLLNLVPSVYITHICLLSFLLAILNIHISILISKQRINSANMVGFIQSFIIVSLLLISFVLLKTKSIHVYLIGLYAGYSGSLLISFFLAGEYFKASEMYAKLIPQTPTKVAKAELEFKAPEC